jgi:catechol 2,3-dioxygenase-like lactoylglutathione lyase family enzyme
MAETKGLHHLGLAVADLNATKMFFTELLGWNESGYDRSYPRTMVTDGVLLLTLWQVDKSKEITPFDRRCNIGLHHLALEVESEAKLNELLASISAYPGASVEFAPELLGPGPRKHMMCNEPGGIRIEFIWQGV